MGYTRRGRSGWERPLHASAEWRSAEPHHVLGRGALGAFHQVELHGFAFDVAGNLWITLVNADTLIALTPDLEVLTLLEDGNPEGIAARLHALHGHDRRDERDDSSDARRHLRILHEVQDEAIACRFDDERRKIRQIRHELPR